MIAGQPPIGPPPHVVAPVALPPFLPGPTIATSTPATSSVPPPALEAPFSAPPPPPADPTDFHLTLSEIQHVQCFQGAQLSWLIQGLKHLCSA